MKIVRVDTDVDDITYGAVEPEGIRIYRGSPFVAWEPTETVVGWEHARLLSPVIPTKVVAVGKNYAEHAAEMGGDVPDSPVLFMKPPTSVIGPLQPIRIPQQTEEVHHEAELAVVIGSVTKNVRIEDVGQHILGYTAANDVTARDLQRADGQWTRAKGFDTFCPLGPAIDTDLDPQEGLVGDLPCQRRDAAVRFHRRSSVWCRGTRLVRLVDHDPVAGRHHLDRAHRPVSARLCPGTVSRSRSKVLACS